jgi:monoamine oxidase
LTSVDAVVVGLGVSGLSALRVLEELGLDCVGIDSRDRTGGRTGRRVTDTGFAFEAGAEFVKAGHARIRALADELGVALVPLEQHGASVVVEDGIRLVVEGATFSDPASAAEYDRVTALFAALVARVAVGRPWEGPDAAVLDATTGSEWIAAQTDDPSVQRRLQRDLVGGLGGLSSEVSLLAVLHYRAAAGSSAGREARIAGGGSALAAGLAERVASPLLLGSRAGRILRSDSGVVVTLESGDTVEARSAVLALSPKLASSIAFDPVLPEGHAALLEGWRQGYGTKTYLAFDRPWWRDRGLAGFASGDLYARSIADVSPMDGSAGVLLAETHPRLGEGTALDAGVHRQRVLDDVATYLGATDEPLRHFGYHAWIEDALAGGCGSPLPPGLLTTAGSALGAPVGPLAFAGTETAAHGWGSLEGAVLAGERAASEVAARLASV